MSKLRVGIAGLDHWYTGIGIVRELTDNPRAELVVAAHQNLDHAREMIEAAGAVATDDYGGVVERDDLDLIVTTCPTVRNVALCTKAAKSGKHILSVKPFAMNMAEANGLRDTVQEAGVKFMSFDALYRLTNATNQYRQWVQDGTLGAPISAFVLGRSSTPTQVWPGIHGDTWWLDEKQVFAGGWIDHAIYQIDALRYIMGADVVRVSGEISNIKHPELTLEDFGVANVVYDNGCVATIEVTWSIEPGAGMGAFHLVGTKKQAVSEPTVAPDRLFTVDMGDEAGWQNVEAPSRHGGQSMLEHMLDCIEDKAEPVATIDDSCAALEACLAFYEAAKTKTVVTL